jgi:DnaJ-class molecular chaperone
MGSAGCGFGSADDIKAAYRRAISSYHSDRVPGSAV